MASELDPRTLRAIAGTLRAAAKYYQSGEARAVHCLTSNEGYEVSLALRRESRKLREAAAAICKAEARAIERKEREK
jgi:hypothetical protein